MYINQELIEVALGKRKADKIISGGKLVNVFTRSVKLADVAIYQDRIAAVGDVGYTRGEETQMIDAAEKYLVPGLIDPHIHPEVSKLPITRFAEAALARGTTSIFCAFDQVGVTAGIKGIRFFLDEVKKTALKTFYSGPSRLPYTTPASTVGFSFHEEEHREVSSWSESSGMWETMVESIENMESSVLNAADELHEKGKLLHGHLPFTFGPQLSAAAVIGVRDDHESWTASEIIQKAEVGICSFLRKASCVDNIKDCIKAVTEDGMPSQYVALCTDDVDASDLVNEGYMDHLVRYAIQLGVDPITAIQMCSLNPAQAGRVDHLVGSITPGRYADILLVNDLTEFKLESVFANGELVSPESASPGTSEFPPYFFNTMKLDQAITKDDLVFRPTDAATSARVTVMQLLPNQIRVQREAILQVKDGFVQPDPVQDVGYISVTDRYTGKGQTASAFFGGFSLKRGAFATSLSPDDDNIICIGVNVDDMVLAINRLFELDGGQIVVCEGKIVEELALPICGIMADISIEEMAAKEKALREALFQQGVDVPKPFFSQIFLSITAIPEFAITDLGFVSYQTKDYVDPIQEWL
jgi:adenine deaminase